jgi:hypothetical protein
MPKNAESGSRQYSFNLLPVTLVDQSEDVFAALCELAHGLAQDEDRLKVWRQLSQDKRGGGLSPERARQLEIAEKILKEKIRRGKNGWYELPEDPQENEQ